MKKLLTGRIFTDTLVYPSLHTIGHRLQWDWVIDTAHD